MINMYKIVKQPIFITLFLIFLVISSCRNENKPILKNESPYFSSLFMPNENTVFRKTVFNLTPEEVRKIETAKLFESAADHLFYEYTFPKDSTTFSEYANVQYFFNELNQLDIITTDIYLNDSLQEKQLKNTLTEYFQQTLGDTENDENNQLVWTASLKDAKTNKSYQYNISLKEIPDEFGVSLEFVRE